MSLSSPLHDSSRTGPPTVVTKPLRFAGSKLQLNVHTGGGGSVIVEMQDIVSSQALSAAVLAWFLLPLILACLRARTASLCPASPSPSAFQ